jgi:hypothetical protein
MSQSDYDGKDGEQSDLLSFQSNTTFYDSEPDETMVEKEKDHEWNYITHRLEGQVNIFFEWTYKSEAIRMLVIGPDVMFPFFSMVLITGPAIVAYIYLLDTVWKMTLFTIFLTLVYIGFFLTYTQDPGMMRKYHHARTTKWTYCDNCESFRPPDTTHCSLCEVCVANYDVSFYYNYSLFLIFSYVVMMIRLSMNQLLYQN